MAQVAWTTYEENPGAKPRLLVLFSPSPSAQMHTEEELKAALVAAETELRQAWLLPGKGEKPSTQGKKPTEDSRHVADMKKRLEESEGESAKLRNLLKDNEIALGMFKLATEDANLATENLKREREGIERTQHQMAEQMAEVRTKLEKALQELQQSKEDQDVARKYAEARKVEATLAKEALEKAQRTHYDVPPAVVPSAPMHNPVLPSGVAPKPEESEKPRDDPFGHDRPQPSGSIDELPNWDEFGGNINYQRFHEQSSTAAPKPEKPEKLEKPEKPRNVPFAPNHPQSKKP